MNRFLSGLRLPEVLRDILVVSALFALNVYIAFNLFITEYFERMDSIEGAYIGLTRYISEQGLGLGWFQQWYGGVPFQNTYPPLLHAFSALLVVLFRVSPAHGHHVASALFYCLGPVAVYFLVKRLDGNWKTALGASVLYSLFCPTAVVSAGLRTWASAGDPARLRAIILFGEGPRVAALTLVPLALWAIDRALKATKPTTVFLASVLTASVVLTNWLGASGLTIAILSYLLAISIERFRVREIWITLGIGILAYGMAMPWIVPSTIGRIRYNAQSVGGEFPITGKHVYYGLAVAAMLAVVFFILRRMRLPVFTAFAGFFSLISLTILLTWEKLQIALLPQPARYHHEVDMALCLLAIGLASILLDRIHWRYVGTVVAIGAVAVGLYQVRNLRRAARKDATTIDIRKTVEYEQATWLQKNKPGQRVFVTGSSQFWLNAFSDVPQVGGGFDQGIVNPQIPIVHFGVPWLKGYGTNSALWLRLFGAASVVVSGPAGRDAYHDSWRDPLKFADIFKEDFRDGDDVIYGVPHDSLAEVIRRSDVIPRTPVNLEDFEPLRAIAERLNDPTRPEAPFRWTSTSEAVIRTKMKSDELLSVQISYHPGWHAVVGGEDRPIQADALGMMLIEPRCAGDCEVQLIYDGGTEMKLAKLICFLSLGGAAYAVWRQLRSRGSLR